MNIVFAGSPHISAEILEKLHFEGFNIPLVISQPDKRSKRGKQPELSEVSKKATELGLNLIKPVNTEDPTFRSKLEALNIDFLIVSAYGKILPKWMLNIPSKMSINIHFSLLPKYRGASPIQAALLNGDSKTGISFIEMNEYMDEGDLINTFSISIQPDENKFTLEKKLSGLAADNIGETISQINSGDFVLKKQNEAGASYCKKINKADGEIDFNESSLSIYNKFRAYYGWPGSYFLYKNIHVKVHEIKEYEKPCSGKPGQIIEISKQGLIIKTIDSAIVITYLQLPNKKIISSEDVRNSYFDFFSD